MKSPDPRSSRGSPRLWAGALAGASFGLLAFALETTLIVRSGAVGFQVDTEGPFAALFPVVRPLLPPLLGRVAVAYGVAGLWLGVAATWLGRPVARGRWAWVLFGVDLAALVWILGWARAIERPALFDDLSFARGTLRRLVDGGEPWHPRAALAAIVAVHLAVGWAKLGRKSLRPLLALASALPVLAVLRPGAPAAPSFSASARAPSRDERPRLVVLFGIDAFRPDRLRAYGGTGEVAPHLEAFLEDATRFDRAYTPLAQTEPAWRSLLTARWPPATGVRYPLTASDRWRELPSFASSLGAIGYRTVFATDCSRFNYLDERSGFAERLQPPRGAINFALEKLRYRGLGLFADNALGARWLPELVENRALAGIYDPHRYAQRLAAKLAARAGEAPTLFGFHATAAHFPGDPVYPHYRRFVSPSEPLERRLRMFFAPIDARGRAANGWGRAQSEALYDELLSQADAQLGILLEELRERGLYDDALVIVFSDHGESFHGDLPHLAGATPVHGARLQEEENRVLLAIKPPGGRKVERVEALVRLVDIGPTVLELAGAEPLPEADGVSLVPRLRGEAIPPLVLYAETGFTHASPDAFDPEHASAAPRTFEAYRVRPDGVVELSAEAHEAVLREKDIGAFDGEGWLIRAPGKDGSIRESCRGVCRPELRRWLDRVSRVDEG